MSYDLTANILQPAKGSTPCHRGSCQFALITQVKVPKHWLDEVLTAGVACALHYITYDTDQTAETLLKYLYYFRPRMEII